MTVTEIINDDDDIKIFFPIFLVSRFEINGES